MRTISFLLLWALAGSLWAQTPQLTQLDAKVVLVTQQVLFPKTSAEAGLWAALEKHLGEPVLGTYLTLSSGTAFFVDTKGTSITNHHVIDKGNEAQRLRDLTKAVQDYISDEVPASVLSNDQKFRMRADVARLLKGASIVLRVKTAAGTVPAQVLADQEKLDLALIRAEVGEPTVPLLLKPDESLPPVGLPVWAAGMPVPDIFSSLFSETRVTVTQGIVSATRDEVWGLQHTAAINPGNSGGPLLDEQGRVVGVNVARITNANSLFFAIGLGKVAQFFRDSGQIDVWQANLELSDNLPAASGLFQKTVGDTVVLNALKGTEVFEDGKRLGVVPLVYEVKKKTVLLTFKGPSGDASAVLNRDPSVLQTVTVDVVLAPKSGTVNFVSTPAGAILVLDGVTKGKAPLSAPLPAGDHTVQWRLDGYEFDTTKISVGAEQKTTVAGLGRALIEVTFDCPLPPGTRLTWTRGTLSSSVVDPSPWRITEGKWQVKVENDDYFETFTFELDSKSPKVTGEKWQTKGRVLFKNVVANTVLLIDNIRSGPAVSGVEIEVPTGRHELKLIADNREPYVVMVDVKRTGVIEVSAGQKIDKIAEHDYWVSVWGYSTLGLAVVSFPMVYVGYQDYQSQLVNSHGLDSPAPSPLTVAGGYGAMGAMITGIFYYWLLTHPVR